MHLQVGRDKESVIPDDLNRYGPAKFLAQNPPTPEVVRVARIHIPNDLRNVKLSRREEELGVPFKAKVNNGMHTCLHTIIAYSRACYHAHTLAIVPDIQNRFSTRCCAM